MGSSGMGVDANGKPIKRQAPANNNNNNKKGGNNNQKKGNNNNTQNKGNNRNNQGNRGGNQPRPHGPPMGMVPPFAPMGQGGFMPPQGNPFFNGNQRRSGGGKNNGNRNGAQQPGYNGPSANTVGQGSVGNNMNGGMAPFGASEPVVEVPGFGKNSNIHELFGKMIWRKMEQIQDASVVDQLQNRIMNLIHDALAGQTEKQQQQQAFNQRPMGFGMPTNQKGPAFNSGGFPRF